MHTEKFLHGDDGGLKTMPDGTNKTCFAKLFSSGLRNPGYHNEKLPHTRARAHTNSVEARQTERGISRMRLIIGFRDAKLGASNLSNTTNDHFHKTSDHLEQYAYKF